VKTKPTASRCATAALGALYFVVWAASLLWALRGDSSEFGRPGGHSSLEVAYFTLVGITQPLGLLAGVLLSSWAPSGRIGITLFWCVAGLLGAMQWLAIALAVRGVWRVFRPSSTSLDLRS
jgi:hypothetical protein